MHCISCIPYSFTKFVNIIFCDKTDNNTKTNKQSHKLDIIQEHTFNEWENISTPR